MSAVIKTQMPSPFKNKKVRDQCAPYHHAQCSSLVDFTEPTLLTYLRYYCIIVAVRSLKWLPLWTWAFANRSRHSEVGEQTSETKFCCCGWICPLDISKDIGVASHMFTRKTIIMQSMMFDSGYWYYLVRNFAMSSRYQWFIPSDKKQLFTSYIHMMSYKWLAMFRF